MLLLVVETTQENSLIKVFDGNSFIYNFYERKMVKKDFILDKLCSY